MRTEQTLWKEDTGWSAIHPESINGQANLVFAFGGIDVIKKDQVFSELQKRYPKAHVVLASTAGEIHGNMVFDDSISVTACQFEHTPIRIHKLSVKDYPNSFSCGEAIREELAS